MNLRWFANPWLLFVLGVALARLTVANNYYFTLLNIIGIHALLVVGLNLLLGYAGQISLGHAGFFAIGAFAQAIFVTRHGFQWFLALPLSGLIAAFFGLLLALPALRLSGPYQVVPLVRR